MHHRTLFAVTLLTIPFAALALDFSRANLPYTDVEKTTPESAAISLLTGEGVVRGYDDGTFRPGQQLNRAEFLKIVIETAYSNFLDAYTGPTESCFVDVPLDAWFMPYACFAKEKGIVSGYPLLNTPKDRWPLKPEQNVNYAEALKILSELYEYTLANKDGDEWYSPYYRAAIEHGTALSVNLPFDAQLTRGQMARLAAAFLAESQGQLKNYRLAERGEYVAPSSSSSVSSAMSSSVSSSQMSSSESSSQSASSSSQGYTLPSASHFLVVGRKSDAIADGVVRLAEDGSIRAAEVSLFQEVRALDVLELTTEDGTLIATLRQRTNATSPDYKQYYEVQLAPEQGFAITGNTDVRLVVRAIVRTPENNGASDQLLQVRTFKVTLVGTQTNTNTNLNLAGPFPKHQTSFGRITAVGSVNPATAPIASGTGMLLGTFTFWGDALSGKQLALTDVGFALERTGTVDVKNIRIGRPGGETTSCTLSTSNISCNTLPATTGAIDQGAALTLELRADVTVTGAAASLETVLTTAGSPEALGSVWWTDQSGRFRWVEGKTAPMARGIRYQ